MNRSETRKVAFELLYSLVVQKTQELEFDEQIEMFLESNGIDEAKVVDYVKDIIYGVERNKESIIEQIKEELTEKWELSRISKINLAILELATYELIYTKVPFKTVIYEAVELAKAYGDDNAPSFVHGVLASIIKKNNIA